MSSFIKNSLSVLLLALSSASFATAPVKTFANRKDVQQFIHAMHIKHGIDQQRLIALFEKYDSDHSILKIFSKPYEALPWYQYQTKVVTPNRTKAGVAFWDQYAAQLKKAESRFGVPAEIIVAILGIETSYGQTTGHYPVLQSLATLAFDYPRRADFFKKELEQFILMTEQGVVDPFAQGSYAGAIGIPQFMPSSYQRFAINFSGTGAIDLIHNPTDAIGSVAYYLKMHGWEKKQKIVQKASASGTHYRKLASVNNAKPTLSILELAQYQVTPNTRTAFPHKHQKISLLVLDHSKDTKEFWIGFQNFYVITRYNKSIHYAMAVYQLSQEILKLRQGRAS